MRAARQQRSVRQRWRWVSISVLSPASPRLTRHHRSHHCGSALGDRGDAMTRPSCGCTSVNRRVDQRSSVVDQLRCDVVQAASMVRLMLDRWLETPDDPGFNYSTLIQQIMSMIAQHGGATAVELHRALCGPGPFRLVGSARFAQLLRAMASEDLIIQASDGLLLHGAVGGRHVNHYGFYTAFQTAAEWRLVNGGKTPRDIPDLGTAFRRCSAGFRRTAMEGRRRRVVCSRRSTGAIKRWKSAQVWRECTVSLRRCALRDAFCLPVH